MNQTSSVYEFRATFQDTGEYCCSQVTAVNDNTLEMRFRAMTNPALNTFHTYAQGWQRIVGLMRAGKVSITTHKMSVKSRKEGEMFVKRQGGVLARDL
jgi:hypothetical protein